MDAKQLAELHGKISAMVAILGTINTRDIPDDLIDHDLFMSLKSDLEYLHNLTYSAMDAA